MSAGVNIAVVGLGFGEDFVPIYQAHPDVGNVALVDTSDERLARVADTHGVDPRFTSYEELLDDPAWDAVHIATPVRHHANHTLQGLRSGKHVACAVPMATTLSEIDAILAAQAESGTQYMMLETSVYAREFRSVEQMHHDQSLGELTMYKGLHLQNLDGYPWYWLGFPPMHYVTHALSPALRLTQTSVRDVVALGSGRLDAQQIGDSGNVFPSETGLFRLVDSDLVAEVTMSFFKAARSYIEGFSVYGSKMSVEWPANFDDPATVYELLDVDPDQPSTGLRGRKSRTWELATDSGTDRLPEPLRRFVDPYGVQSPTGGAPLWKAAEHGGSHPHLVEAFISSIVTGESPEIGPLTAAEWTAPGICGHTSAVNGGERISVPTYRNRSK